MAQLITLEDAAERLGISPEELRKRLKTDPEFKKLSQIRDGSTVRFKAAAIEELSRQLGMASDEGLTMAPMEDNVPPGSDDYKVKPLDKRGKKDDAPLQFDSTDDDVFSLADEPKQPTPKSSGKLTPNKPAKTSKGMSDNSEGSSDSDVRLDDSKAKKGKSDESAVPTEEIAIDFSGPGSAVIKGGSSAKLSAPKTTGSSGKLTSDSSKIKGKGKAKPPSENDSSEFELSLDADSDDFDLQMNPEAGDEVELGTIPKEKGDASSGKRGSASGINLRDPADSGISLENKNKGKEKDKKAPPEEDSDSDVDFELSLDSSAVSSSTKLGAPKSGKLILDADSDSEFELTLDDSSGSSLEQAALGEDALGEQEDKGDIFETDFEIPPMPDESGSEAVALESDTDLEKSDFELAMDDSDVASEEEASASEVVLLEDEEESPKVRAKPSGLKGKPKKKPDTTEDADVDVDLADADADDASVSKVLKGAKGKKKGQEDSEDQAVPAGAAAPTKPWGIVPVLFLAPALLFTLVGALMGYELLQTMWGYQQPRKPTAPIVRGIASQFDMELRDQ